MSAHDRAAVGSSGPASRDRGRAGRPVAPITPDEARLADGAATAHGSVATLGPAGLLRLQGFAGNAAVSRLVASTSTRAAADPALIQRDPIDSGGGAGPDTGAPEPGSADTAATTAATGAPPADPMARPELHPGDGPTADVGILQQKLNATGAATPPLRITAVYGPATTAAVISFQTNHALPPTGEANAPTWSELDRLAPSVVRNGRIVVDAPGGANPLGTPQGSTHPTIRRGSTGPAVEELQQRLNNAPSTEVPTLLDVDGKFGPRTRQAVREFQAAHPPLDQDGVVGPKTWALVDQIPGGVTVGRVEFYSDERVEGNVYGGDSRYTWRLTDDALEVVVNIRFTGLRNHPQVAAWMGQIASTWNVFKFVDDATPGRELALRFVANRASPGDNTVRVYSASMDTPQGRSNSGNWNVQDTDPGLAPHEFGHLIGLQDEYRLGADIYRATTGEEAFVGEVTGDADPQVIADQLWTALNSSPRTGRTAKAQAVITAHHLTPGAFSQRVAEAYELTHAADMKREDDVPGVGLRVVPNPGGTIDLDIAARLPGQDDESDITEPFTYDNRSLMGNMASLSNPRAMGGVSAAHDHPVEERHVRHFLQILRANRPGTWRLVRL